MTNTPAAVITGAASGIGRALAVAAATEHGLHAALLDVDGTGLDRVVEQIHAAGGAASAHPVDVTDAAAVDRVAAHVVEAYGAPELVVCNAGVEYTGHLWEMTPEAWQRIQRINVDGAFYVARAFLPGMIARGVRSRVLFTSSVGGVSIGASQGAYTVSKHAIRVLAQSFAADLADAGAQVDVSIVLPAAVQTRIFESAETSGNEASEAYRVLMRDHLANDGKTPEEVAEIIFAGIQAGKRWIYPHADQGAEFVRRHTAELLEGAGVSPAL